VVVIAVLAFLGCMTMMATTADAAAVTEQAVWD
jgi:hypothetical protein